MTTNNGYKYVIKDGVCYLFIPKKQGVFTDTVQSAKREIIENESLYFKEIKVCKTL